ncbi:hypothetical protein L198_07724 [Cryptococcus wingfieldii CBS 7118]|uniref:Uncharacterized protein n=1 Tax=Cryptococcus wingfieldii CBS 7118 TaxID=1295528 RepID=A0A1E3I1L1_9TREE|nr:hypothetical protein L198_07724 [Cryptococcus wingfieldii CBS 7118]ODN82502.1 hypothetical protein L198_07724 [Cryptococcus wingfieldii CBS 7118]
MDPAAWSKVTDGPVFSSSDSEYGPGHNGNGLKGHYFTEFAHQHIKVSRQEACKAWLACIDLVHILEWLSKAPPKLVAQKARAIDTDVASWGMLFNAPTNDFSNSWWRLLFREWRNVPGNFPKSFMLCTHGKRTATFQQLGSSML